MKMMVNVKFLSEKLHFCKELAIIFKQVGVVRIELQKLCKIIQRRQNFCFIGQVSN